MPHDWIERVNDEIKDVLKDARTPRKVLIAPEDADRINGSPAGSFGDGGIVGSIGGVPMICTYRVRIGFWIVAT